MMARAVVWAETFNPGAAIRVDDVSNPTAPVVLWQGTAPNTSALANVAQVTLPTPQWIRAVRLLLDTRRVPGENKIDAIGVAPATLH